MRWGGIILLIRTACGKQIVDIKPVIWYFEAYWFSIVYKERIAVMEAKYFNARWDSLLKWSTAGVIVVMAIVIRVSFMPEYISELPVSVIRATLFAILLAAFLLAPRYYMIVDKSLVIKRYLGHITIPLSDFASIRALDAGEMRFAIRTFGVGGFFGYYGRFWCRSMGSFRAYITDRSNCVVIQTRQGRKIVISPENRQEFLEMTKALI